MLLPFLPVFLGSRGEVGRTYTQQVLVNTALGLIRAYEQSGNGAPETATSQPGSGRWIGSACFFQDVTSPRGSFGILDGYVELMALAEMFCL